MNVIRKADELRAEALSDESGRPIAAVLAEFAARLRLDDVPDRVIERAKLHILDCLGIALASTTFDFAHRTANAVRGLAGDGEFPVIGMSMKLPVRDQVMLNGTLIHGLDFDDTHTDGVIHASCSALATVLGQGLRQGVTGEEGLLAFLIAVEASARIGQAARGGFHRRGHHPTGLVGAFGCTLGAGVLSDLAERQLAHAQGIVLSMAGGSLEFLSDGAWTKRMHPGWAGVAAITAAALAKEGFVGPSAAYEGRYGLYNLHLGAGHDADLSLATRGLGEVWELENVGFKPYPACHFNHSYADAMLAMKREHGLTAADVESITALVAETSAAVVCEPLAQKRRPQNAYDAQFSIPYIVAQCLVNDRFTLDELDADAISDPAVLEVAAKVDWRPDPDTAFPRYYSGALELKTKDGRELFHREAVNRGSDANPLTAEDIKEKYWANAERAVSRAQAERVFEAVMGLDDSDDLWELMDALARK